nr:putative AC transposase [Tanacetum cinerariifolium]
MSRDGSISVYNPDVLREQFAGLVIQRGLPFNHFDDEQTTRVFQKHLQPKYNRVSHTTLKRDATELWVAAKQAIIDDFLKLNTNVNLTTDIWSAPHGVPDKLYFDVIINQGRGLQVTQNVEDSHVTLTPVQPDGLQESSSVSSFVTIREAVQIQTDRLQDSLQRENDEFLPNIDENMKKIIKGQVKNQVKEQVSRILPRIEESVNATLEAEVLIEKMEGNKSIQRSDKQRNLYKALVKAYDADKAILDTYGESTILKRRREDNDQEGPSAGSDRGSKRQKEGGEHASASIPSETATGGAGRSTTGSQSQQLSASESAFAEEPVQTTCQMEEPPHLVFETGADDQPIVQTSQHPEWFSQPRKPPSSDHFSNFIMNRLNVDTLTLELLAGPTYKLMRGSCTSLTELEYHLEEVYKATTDQLDWVNPEGASSRKYTTSVTKTKAADYGHIKRIEDLVPRTMWIQQPIDYNRRIIAVTELKIMEWHDYKHLNWISVRRDDDQIYKFKEGDFKRLRLQDIEDMLPEASGRSLTGSGKLPEEAQPYKARHYLPTTIWRRGDKDIAAAMIQAIDKMLKIRRIMRSLEKFVGGRLYEGDFRMLQRTEKSEKLGRVPTEMELILEHTQQGISHEVSVSIEGVEELKRNDKIKGVKKEALLIHLGRNRVNTNAIRNTMLLSGHKNTLVSDLLIDFQIKFSLSIGEIVTHWFTLIVLSALRHSNNENMLSLVILILREHQRGVEIPVSS